MRVQYAIDERRKLRVYNLSKNNNISLNITQELHTPEYESQIVQSLADRYNSNFTCLKDIEKFIEIKYIIKSQVRDYGVAQKLLVLVEEIMNNCKENISGTPIYSDELHKSINKRLKI